MCQVEIETGKVLGIRTLAKSDIDMKGERECFFEFNGHLRTHKTRDLEASKVSTTFMSCLLC